MKRTLKEILNRKSGKNREKTPLYLKSWLDLSKEQKILHVYNT